MYHPIQDRIEQEEGPAPVDDESQARDVVPPHLEKIGIGRMLPAISNHGWCRIENPLYRIGYPLGQKQTRRGTQYSIVDSFIDHPFFPQMSSLAFERLTYSDIN